MRTRAMRNDMADIVCSTSLQQWLLMRIVHKELPRDARSMAPKSGPAFLCQFTDVCIKSSRFY